MESPTLFTPVTIQPAAVVPVSKTITWPTNFNQKMSCSGFIHIDLMPYSQPVRSQVEGYIIDIYTADQSHPPIQVQAFDILPMQLKKIPCMLTLSSHGMDEMEFIDYMYHRHPNKVNFDTQLAIYYYKKISRVKMPNAIMYPTA